MAGTGGKAKRTRVIQGDEYSYTEKEEGFCQMMAAGASQWEAYHANYETNGKGERECRGAIGKVARKPKTKARVQEIVMDKFMPFILEQQERMRILSHIAVTGSTRDSLTAIDQLNRIDGSYNDKVNIDIKAEVRYKSLEEYYIAIEEKKKNE